MGSCSACESFILGGRKLGESRYCSDACYRYGVHPGYCSLCAAETTDEGAGGTFTLNFVGTRMLGFGQRCPLCNSQSQRRWICLVIPTLPTGPEYRVINLGSRYLSRKVVATSEQRAQSKTYPDFEGLVLRCAREASAQGMEEYRSPFDAGRMPWFQPEGAQFLNAEGLSLSDGRGQAQLDAWDLHLGVVGACTCLWAEHLGIPIEKLSAPLVQMVAGLQGFRLCGFADANSPQRLFLQAAIMGCQKLPLEVMIHGLWCNFAPHCGIPKNRHALAAGMKLAEHFFQERSRLLRP